VARVYARIGFREIGTAMIAEPAPGLWAAWPWVTKIRVVCCFVGRSEIALLFLDKIKA
jgi:hypothetical protein